MRLRATALGLLWALSAGLSSAAAVETSPLVRPDLSGFEPAVAALLSERQARLDTLLESASLTDDEAAVELGALGRLYLAYNLAEAAESCLVNAARLAPAEPAWVYLVGLLRQERAELGEARAAFERTLQLVPGDRAATLRLARAEFELGHPERALPLFEQLVAVPGFEAVAHYGLGRIAADAGELDRAVEHLEAAVALQPDAGPPRYQLAIAYRRRGEPERARDQLERRGKGELSFPDPALDGLGAEAQGAEIFLSSGRKARQRRDYESALAAFRKAIEMEPGELEHRKVLGATLLEMGRAEESVAVYSDVLAKSADDPEALYNLAVALTEVGSSGEAVGHYRRLVELAPDHADGRVNLASLLERSGELVEAEKLLGEAIELEPYDVSLKVHRASVWASMGRAAEARRALREVLDGDPTDAEALIVLGVANEALGSQGDAVAAWRQAAEAATEPDTEARARVLLGSAHLQAGRAAPAAEELARAVEVLPESAEARALLAGALGAQGDFDGAAEQYGSALALAPGDDNARFGRAISLLLGDREVEARAHLEQTLAVGGDNVALRHLLARLLATAKDPAARDGQRALEMAQQVFSEVQTLDHAETLAMALAEVGQFDAAIEWQTRIMERARAVGDSGRLSRLEARRVQYERQEKVRAPWLNP